MDGFESAVNEVNNFSVCESRIQNHRADNATEIKILDHIQKCPAIFQNQQIDDPELSDCDKRRIAQDILHSSPAKFLTKFGRYLNSDHLNYFLIKWGDSYEVKYSVKDLINSFGDQRQNQIRRNRRYEAMKRMETAGKYFSEAEMEKRQPLLYHQMVGQYLTEKEKIIKNRQAQGKLTPTLSSFLIDKMEREELNELLKHQQEEENNFKELSDEEESENQTSGKRWGYDWEDEVACKIKTRVIKRHEKKISKQEKLLLFQEFKSIMQSNFLNGMDIDFDYSEIDSNPEYDCLELKTQDEEEKYFDDESCDNSICTDTGVLDY